MPPAQTTPCPPVEQAQQGPHAAPLAKLLRTQLERTVKAARDVAEKAALVQLAVHEATPPAYLTEAQKALRRQLRAHGRALGDAQTADATQATQQLVGEVAYQHWHRMLFARYLAENKLLMWEAGAAVSLDDCRNLVDNYPADALGAKTHWALAGLLAARMLPQIFKAQSPVFALHFSSNEQHALENLLLALPLDTFTASDSLGWVYQFWQARRKEEVNASGSKIGAQELPAVTQLFTEPYMVDFLLHNSLGAWWHTRHPGIPCPVPMPYLRLIDAAPSPATETDPTPRHSREGGNPVPQTDATQATETDHRHSREGGNPVIQTDATQATETDLRHSREGGNPVIQTPAAGAFESWPKTLKGFKLLDPSCGSGHFLVAAFALLVPLRMADEGLSAQAAVDAVLQDNLHGLEIDPRCVEIAVFALALAAWRTPDERGNPLGVRPEMPTPHIACCGLSVAARPQDWEALVPDTDPNAKFVRQELRLLHSVFAQAPLLGSLLNPSLSIKDDLATSSFETLQILLKQALGSEQPATLWRGAQALNDDAWDLALSAQGLLAAAALLDARYHLVITNVPYLARGKQEKALKDYCETHYPHAKNDLANVFLERCLALALPDSGVVQIVMPQNWLFLSRYKAQRQDLLKRVRWNLLARLGPGAFETISGEVVQAILLTQTNALPHAQTQLHGLDASAPRTAAGKAECLGLAEVKVVSQQGQLGNPDARVALEDGVDTPLLEMCSKAVVGIQTGDFPQFGRHIWELNANADWEFEATTLDETASFDGKCFQIYWQNFEGVLAKRQKLGQSYVRGWFAFGKSGVLVSSMGSLPVTLYGGELFDNNSAVIIPHNPAHLSAIWCFCASPAYNEAVRRIDQKLNVTNATLVKVPFDLAHWSAVAAQKYPHGLPKPYSDDPTQWLFHGHPQAATDPLQVAVARLLGYVWPAELSVRPELAEGFGAAEAGAGIEKREVMELSDAAHRQIARCAALAPHADDDGIVCLPAVRGEKPAHERLLALLIDAWQPDALSQTGSQTDTENAPPARWSPAVLEKLLAQADCAGKGLAVWLRDSFFEQHAKRFHHRPFIWHVWDGQKDGFAALVNAHKLDAKNLERLIHTYLGDWLRTQEAGVASGTDGAPQRLAAAQHLKTRLQAILQGEAPLDIFVRWKPLAEQPLGWQPDPNDGVRLNIRPFMAAEVLRVNKKPKLNITWDKDRGQDVATAPWYGVFKGERINDHHLSLAEKQAARQAAQAAQVAQENQTPAP